MFADEAFAYYRQTSRNNINSRKGDSNSATTTTVSSTAPVQRKGGSQKDVEYLS